MPTTTTAAMDFRGGITRLLGWLNDYPSIHVAYIHFADNAAAELVAPAGLFDALTAAADVADALTDPVIEVTDPDHKRVTWITVHGIVADRAAAPLDLTVEGSCYDSARVALLASLGAPAIPGARTWTVTAEHLRGVVKARCT